MIKRGYIQFQGNIQDIRCDVMTSMINRGYEATSRGLPRPLSVALRSCSCLELSNFCQNKFSHTPKPVQIKFQGNIKDIRCDIMIKRGYEATSSGLRRPLSVALGSCRPLELSN